MKTNRILYLGLTILGTIIPYSQFLPWLREHGSDTHLFLQQLFANRISSFFALDLLLSAVVLIGYIRRRGAQAGLPHLWLPIAATLLVGVSCGFPLFLYMLESRTIPSSKLQIE